MSQQTGNNVIIAYKVESAFNTAPGATGAERLRLTGSPGLSMQKALIQSNEVRPDLLSTLARHGSRSVPGTYNSELSVGSFDTILEAVMRGTWDAAVAITEADMTSITTTTSTIVASAGSWITEGVRVGDIARLTGHSTAANNDLNLRVTGVTASTLTVAGTPLTLNASADSAFTLTVLKKLYNPAAAVRRSFYFDEYNADIDVSEVYGGARFTRFRIVGAPDGMATIEIGLMGVSQEVLASGASPYYTDPTEYVTLPLTFADASIRFLGAEVATLTSFDLTYEIDASTLPVIGGPTSPDVFDNAARLSGNVSGLRADLSRVSAFNDETEFELHILLEDNEASGPKGCISLFVPLAKLTSVDAPVGQSGAMVESMGLTAGVKPTTAGYDATLLTICTSAG